MHEIKKVTAIGSAQGLNARQRLFAEHYSQSFSAVDAAKRAGYSVKTARTVGSRLLTHVDIQGYLRRLTEQRFKNINLSGQQVLEQVARLAFGDPRGLVDRDTGKPKKLHELDSDTAALLSSFTLRESDGETQLTGVKLSDKTRSLELLAKHLGILVEKHEHLHGAMLFSSEQIAGMSDAQLDKLEVAQRIIIELRAELTTHSQQ